MTVIDRAASEHHTMRVESRGGDGCLTRGVAHAQVAHVRLETGEVLEAGVEDADGVVCTSRGENGRVLVHGEGAQIARLVWVARLRGDGAAHADVPEADAAVAFGCDELAHAAAL